MCSGERRLDFLGLTGTMLSDEAARLGRRGRDSQDPAGHSFRYCAGLTPDPDGGSAECC